MSDDAAQREARANEMCLNCGSSRWKHHTFAGIGTLCPGNRGAARFPDKKPSPDLVTVPRAELEAIRDTLTRVSNRSGQLFVQERLSPILAKLEDYLKGQP